MRDCIVQQEGRCHAQTIYGCRFQAERVTTIPPERGSNSTSVLFRLFRTTSMLLVTYAILTISRYSDKQQINGLSKTKPKHSETEAARYRVCIRASNSAFVASS